jgi:hypothetical protein
MAAVAGQGVETFAGSGGVSFGAPSISAASTETFVGTAGVGFGSPGFAGIGVETIPGSGNLSFSPASASTGAETFEGSGGLSMPSFSMAGTGAGTSAGTGNLGFASPSISGSGVEKFVGSGGLSFAVPSVDGSGSEIFTGSGSLGFGPPSIDGSGASINPGMAGYGNLSFSMSMGSTGKETIPGSGGMEYGPGFSGVGGEEFAGTGGLSFSILSISGSALAASSGTGGLGFGAPSFASSGAETFKGSGDLHFHPAISGTGTVLAPATGTGNLTFGFSIAGSGKETITGTGGISFPPGFEPLYMSGGAALTFGFSIHSLGVVDNHTGAPCVEFGNADDPCADGWEETGESGTFSGSGPFRSGDLPDVYLELNCCNMSATGYTAGQIYRTGIMEETLVPFDPADYDGDCEFWFEVTVHNASGSYGSTPIPTFLSLMGGGATLATIPIPIHPDNYEFYTYRTQFAPPSGPVNLGLLCPAMGAEYGQWLLCSFARVRIRQTGATKSRIQWPMLSFGTFWSTGYKYVANSISVYDCPTYTPDFSGFGGGGYALENLPIWKFNAEDLATVSEVEFRVLPGKYVYQPNVEAHAWGLQEGTLITSVGFLVYSDDGGVTKLPAITIPLPPGVPDSYFEFSAMLGDPYPWTFSVELDPSQFMANESRIWYWGWAYGGGTFVYAQLTGPSALYIPAGSNVVKATWSGYTASLGAGEGPWAHDNVQVVRLDLVCDEANVEGLSVAVFDRDANAMIAGSELTWAKGEQFGWKSASISPSAFTSGHEIEVRCESPSDNYNTAPTLGEAQLYFNIDPISIFTSWQRVMAGSMYGFWDYPPAYGERYAFRWSGCVSALSRLEYHEIEDATVNYQACATAYVWPSEGYDYDPNDPGAEYEYFSLWDDGVNDSGVRDTPSRVDISMLNWLVPDFGPDDEHRTLKRTSADISSSLTDGNRYCSLQPDDMCWLIPLDGYLAMTVVGSYGGTFTDTGGTGPGPTPPCGEWDITCAEPYAEMVDYAN